MFYFTKLRGSDLERLNRHTIDVFDRLDNLFQRSEFTHSMRANYPPHNIKKQGDQYLIEMAVAGFSQEEISITKEKDYLIIEGHKEQGSDDSLVYQGIANRGFKKSFVLGERMKVIGAEVKNGMLFIGLEQEVLYH